MISSNDAMDALIEHVESLCKVRPGYHRKPRPARRGPKLKDFYSRSDINLILERESARCERNGREFSLVVIKAATENPQRHLLRLGKLLADRARLTDEIGWFDFNRLCIVLPDTSFEAAQRFVSSFTEAAIFNAMSPICRTMTYPSDWHPDEMAASAKFLCDEHNLSAILVRPTPLWKRAVDLAIGSIALTLALPIMGAAALGVFICGGGSILAKDQRAGLGGRPFNMLRFRTRKTEVDENGEVKDSGFTRIGEFLRETGVEELPLLLNVLRGDMSLVGPRPLSWDENLEGGIWRRRRLGVLPGLTSIARVNKQRPGSTTATRMDRSYMNWRSFMSDLKLICLTIPMMIVRRQPMLPLPPSLSPLWPAYPPEMRKLADLSGAKKTDACDAHSA